MAQSSGVWCKTINHESQHFIVDGEAACKTAKAERWALWALVPTDEINPAKQCCRCKGFVAGNNNRVVSLEDMEAILRANASEAGRQYGAFANRCKVLLQQLKKADEDVLTIQDFRDYGRKGGIKGGRVSSPAKARAARRREQMKRKHKGGLCSGKKLAVVPR
jgi:hypothetical protein